MLDRELVTDLAFRAPASGAEAAVARMIEEILKVQPVGADDSITELGGTSLDAVQLGGRVREAYGDVEDLADTIRHGTVSDIAGRLEALAS